MQNQKLPSLLSSLSSGTRSPTTLNYLFISHTSAKVRPKTGSPNIELSLTEKTANMEMRYALIGFDLCFLNSQCFGGFPQYKATEIWLQKYGKELKLPTEKTGKKQFLTSH